MANTKKYVSLDKLSLYDEKIKKVIADADAAALASAKEYANSLATNYDVAGSAATVQGELDKEVIRAKAREDEIDGKVSTLGTLVGVLPEGTTATSVVDYVNKKTEGIATDTALAELNGQVSGLQTTVQGIAADYLKNTDKTELEGKIGAKADQTALDAEIQRATQAEAGLQTQINTIMNNPDAEGAINSINEFTQYIADHGTIADGFRADIDQNKADIAAEVKRAGDAEAELAGRLDVLEAIDHDAYVDADTALKNELNAEIAKKADDSALTSAVQALEGADSALSGRIATLEGKFGGADGSVEDMIADAKQGAIDTAAADATSKANAAEVAAKGHADSLNTAMNTRVEALEAIDHDHANKTELDLIASGDKAKWDEAYAKRHEHSNLTVLEGITSAKVTAWDAAEGNAKTYADGLNTAMNTRVEAIETWHSNFVEVSEEEINNLFKA